MASSSKPGASAMNSPVCFSALYFMNLRGEVLMERQYRDDHESLVSLGGGGGRWLIVLDGRREAAPRSLATFSCEKRLILSRTRPLRG